MGPTKWIGIDHISYVIKHIDTFTPAFYLSSPLVDCVYVGQSRPLLDKESSTLQYGGTEQRLLDRY